MKATCSTDIEIKTKTALRALLDALDRQRVQPRFQEAVQQSDGDMMKRMQFVYPLQCQLQMDTLESMGYPKGMDGMVIFQREVCEASRNNKEIDRLSQNVKEHLMPPLLN